MTGKPRRIRPATAMHPGMINLPAVAAIVQRQPDLAAGPFVVAVLLRGMVENA